MKFSFLACFLKKHLLPLAVVVNMAFVVSVHANNISSSIDNNIGNSITKSIDNKIEEKERELGARIGVAIYDVTKSTLWNYNGDTRFPLMSTFKTLACAKLLVDVENGVQSFDTSTVITKDLLIEWSPKTEKYIGKLFSLKQACSAAMIMSDNTAANLVLRGIKGPKVLTQFMRSIGDEVTRLDRIEPDLNEARNGDKRDTTTPNAMALSLHTLLFGDVLSQQSKSQLKQWMIDSKVTGSLLRSVLPANWSIADRAGAGGYGSRGITAVVWADKRSPLIISIYLTQTEASFAQRNKAIADIGNEIFTVYSR
jgi:beta-lactamase class A